MSDNLSQIKSLEPLFLSLSKLITINDDELELINVVTILDKIEKVIDNLKPSFDENKQKAILTTLYDILVNCSRIIDEKSHKQNNLELPVISQLINDSMNKLIESIRIKEELSYDEVIKFLS